LVNERLFEDGRRLLVGLVRDGLKITVAFWVRLSERGSLYLYIASPEILPGR
jgi:hypothetical protein